ncbi:MAG: hypothetical protein SPJ22_04045 [Frisingicoccus sp.]|nr:hypothetical protein [Frisingicoccus sp.]
MFEIKKLTSEEEDTLLWELFQEEPNTERMAVITEAVINVVMEQGCRPLAFVVKDPADFENALMEWHKVWTDVPIIQIDARKYCDWLGVSAARGVFSIMKLVDFMDYSRVLMESKKIIVVDIDRETAEKELNETENQSIGDIAGVSMRTGVALGVDALLITESTRPYFDYRLIRDSMGNLLRVPIGIIPDLDKGGMDILKDYGFTTFALSFGDEDDVPVCEANVFSKPRQAMILQNRVSVSKVDYRVFADFGMTDTLVPVIAQMTVLLWEFLK